MPKGKKPLKVNKAHTRPQHVAVAEYLGEGRSKKEALLLAGYSKHTAIKPSQVLESKGFQQLLAETLPDNLILDSLREDIEAKPQHRVRELELASKIKGWHRDVAPQVQVSVGVVVLPTRDVIQTTEDNNTASQ
jgi:hypothetical protein